MINLADFNVYSGPSNIVLAEAAHILIPGRGRDATGQGLSQHSIDRNEMAAGLYLALHPELIAGIDPDIDYGNVVPSGYKTPGDNNGLEIVLFDEETGSYNIYRGNPEAYSGGLLLHKRGVHRQHISPEMNSIDTVTNFVRSEQGGHFGRQDERPVAIVAQEGHLERMMDHIARKTLRRDYIGVVVPELEGPDADSLMARFFSQAVTLGLNPNSRDVVRRTDKRAQLLWQAVLFGQRMLSI
jgi:hypothetical protein